VSTLGSVNLASFDRFKTGQLQQSVLDQLNWLKPELSKRYETWRQSQDAQPMTEPSSTTLDPAVDKTERDSEDVGVNSEDEGQPVEKGSELDSPWIVVHYVPRDQRSDPFACVCLLVLREELTMDNLQGRACPRVTSQRAIRR
jgi:hypothetical protein